MNPKIRKLLFDYFSEAEKEIRKKFADGKGGEILGNVKNRPEDIEIGIDRVGEEVLEKLLKKYKVKATVFSEPDGRDIETGKESDFYGSIDPFDGSMLFLRGFEHNWYSVLSFFNKERNPICCGVLDILNKKLFINEGKENYLLDIVSGKKKKVYPSSRKDLKGEVVLASYLMSPRYSVKFFDCFSDTLKKLHSKALVYPQGGSFIYAYLASGLIDAYIMFDEPRSEIDPGYCMAKAAGCPVVSVDKSGKVKDYEFIPGRQHGKVDFFVAAATPELCEEIINIYKKNYGKKRKK